MGNPVQELTFSATVFGDVAERASLANPEDVVSAHVVRESSERRGRAGSARNSRQDLSQLSFKKQPPAEDFYEESLDIPHILEIQDGKVCEQLIALAQSASGDWVNAQPESANKDELNARGVTAQNIPLALLVAYNHYLDLQNPALPEDQLVADFQHFCQMLTRMTAGVEGEFTLEQLCECLTAQHKLKATLNKVTKPKDFIANLTTWCQQQGASATTNPVLANFLAQQEERLKRYKANPTVVGHDESPVPEQLENQEDNIATIFQAYQNGIVELQGFETRCKSLTEFKQALESWLPGADHKKEMLMRAVCHSVQQALQRQWKVDKGEVARDTLRPHKIVINQRAYEQERGSAALPIAYHLVVESFYEDPEAKHFAYAHDYVAIPQEKKSLVCHSQYLTTKEVSLLDSGLLFTVGELTVAYDQDETIINPSHSKEQFNEVLMTAAMFDPAGLIHVISDRYMRTSKMAIDGEYSALWEKYTNQADGSDINWDGMLAEARAKTVGSIVERVQSAYGIKALHWLKAQDSLPQFLALEDDLLKYCLIEYIKTFTGNQELPTGFPESLKLSDARSEEIKNSLDRKDDASKFKRLQRIAAVDTNYQGGKPIVLFVDDNPSVARDIMVDDHEHQCLFLWAEPQPPNYEALLFQLRVLARANGLHQAAKSYIDVPSKQRKKYPTNKASACIRYLLLTGTQQEKVKALKSLKSLVDNNQLTDGQAEGIVLCGLLGNCGGSIGHIFRPKRAGFFRRAAVRPYEGAIQRAKERYNTFTLRTEAQKYFQVFILDNQLENKSYSTAKKVNKMNATELKEYVINLVSLLPSSPTARLAFAELVPSGFFGVRLKEYLFKKQNEKGYAEVIHEGLVDAFSQHGRECKDFLDFERQYRAVRRLCEQVSFTSLCDKLKIDKDLLVLNFEYAYLQTEGDRLLKGLNSGDIKPEEKIKSILNFFNSVFLSQVDCLEMDEFDGLLNQVRDKLLALINEVDICPQSKVLIEVNAKLELYRPKRFGRLQCTDLFDSCRKACKLKADKPDIKVDSHVHVDSTEQGFASAVAKHSLILGQPLPVNQMHSHTLGCGSDVAINASDRIFTPGGNGQPM